MGIEPSRGQLQPAPATAPGGLRLLVAEDHEVGLELTCLMAHRLGAEVEGAADGYQAIRLIKAARAEGRPYSLVLMDFMMPVVDGIEATRRLRRAGISAEELPVIALTAVIEQREIGRFIDAGGQGYVAKPLNLEKLSTVLEAWLPASSPAPAPATAVPQAEPFLAGRYAERKRATLARIDQAITERRPSAAQIEEIRDLLHKLAGTAGLFGDEALSAAASLCESELVAAAPSQVLAVLTRNRPALGATA